MLVSKAKPRKAAAVLLVLAITAAITLTGLSGLPSAQAAYADPANYVIGLHTPAKITKLIYPTIGTLPSSGKARTSRSSGTLGRGLSTSRASVRSRFLLAPVSR